MYSAWAKVLALTFIIVLVCLATASEWMLRTQVAPANVRKQHAEFFRAGMSKNAAFGGSLTTYGFTGGTEIASYADTGEPFIITAEKIRYHYSKVSPGLVILQADPMRFSTARNDSIPKIEERRKLVFGREESILMLTIQEHRGSLSSLWWTYLRKGKIQSRTQLTADGSRTRDDRFDDFSPKTRTRQTQEFLWTLQPATPSLASNRNWTAFRDIVHYLRARGAKVCLLQYPASLEFRALARNEPFYAQTKAAIQNFADETGIVFADASEWVDATRLFADTYHLSYLGAPPFSAHVVPLCRNGVKPRD